MSNHPRRGRARSGPSSSLPTQTAPAEAVAGHHHARHEHILKEALQTLIDDEARDPAVEQVELLRVHLSPDGGHATVAYAVKGEPSQEDSARHRSREALGRANPYFRARLAATLDLERLPTFSFTFVGMLAEPLGGERWPD